MVKDGDNKVLQQQYRTDSLTKARVHQIVGRGDGTRLIKYLSFVRSRTEGHILGSWNWMVRFRTVPKSESKSLFMKEHQEW